MRHRAFTLVELLVVIAIIAALAGMVTVGMGIAGKTKARTKTQALMAQLQADLTSFRTVQGWYPEEQTKPQLPTGFEWVGSAGAYGSTINDLRTADAVDWTMATQCLVHQLNTMGSSYKQPLVDAWGKTLRYRPAKYHPFLPSPPQTVDGQDPPGKDTYQLWSTGPDGTENFGTGDDLTSWAK